MTMRITHSFQQIFFGLFCLLMWAFLPASRVFAAEIINTDVCVYGATSGGVIAAVQLKRMQKTVALASFNTHVGGMTSGGLGWVDFGKREAVGGLALEYFNRIGKRYGKTEPTFAVEPHVAEEEFRALLTEADVPIRWNQRLKSVTKVRGVITQITMEDGTVYLAKMFIDASYEGDLMSKAGVSFAVGRESVAKYGESLAGVRSEPWKVLVSPYMVPGNPDSSVLPLIGEDTGIANGEADNSVMSCNYRLCLTQNPSNKLPITAPEGYQEATYELLGRLIDAKVAQGAPLKLTTFIKMSRLPHGKTDVNSEFSVSTDFVGQSHNYPNASYSERTAIEQAHRNYIQGLLYYLGTSAHVPADVRAQMQTWGFCADEFQDTGGWPHQFYVREARRMIGDYVMVQQNVQGLRVAPESVGLASYRVDSHSVNRFMRGGVLMTDGDLRDAYPKPYPISYRCIVPRKEECQNLFVPFALSASHVAFTSIRMEPVFMILGQSAADAASLAIENNVAVQDVEYKDLKAKLVEQKQVLQWGQVTDQAPIANVNTDSQAALRAFFGHLENGDKQTVVVYGTSLTHNGAWTTALRRWLDKRFPGQVAFFNSGLSGKNSDDGVAQMQSQLLDHRPDLAFIEFAINDAHKKFEMPVERGYANLNTIVQAIRNQNGNAAIVLQAMDIPWDAPNGNRSLSDRPRLKEFNDNYRTYAHEHALPFIDHNADWFDLQRTDLDKYHAYLPDGLHPTKEGDMAVTWPRIEALLTSGQNAVQVTVSK